MTKLVVIGAGQHSQLHHGPAVRALRSRLDRAVVADLNLAAAESYAAKFGFDGCYGSVEKMLESESPDAVIAVTPEPVTAGMFRQLIPYRLPMLMEKPFGENVRETSELCKLAEAENTRTMISFNRRHAPVCRRVRELISGRFSDRPVRHIRAAMLRSGRLDANFLPATSIHLIDTVNYLCGGEPEAVAVQSSHRSPNGAVAVSAQLAFPSGVTAELLVDSDCGMFGEIYEVFGPGYRIWADYFRGLKVFEAGRLVDAFEFSVYDPLEVREGAVAELDAFLSGVETGAAFFSPPPGAALAAARIAEKLQQSAKERK